MTGPTPPRQSIAGTAAFALNWRDAADPRPARRRPHAASHRPAHAESRALRRARRAAAAADHHARRDVLACRPRSHRLAAARSRHRRQWLVFRDLSEVWLWRQSNRLVAGEKVWDAGKRRDPSFTCAKMFWWYNMCGERTTSASRRARSTRRTAASCPTATRSPPRAARRAARALGPFPLFNFWGPAPSIDSQRAGSPTRARHVMRHAHTDADARLPAAPRLRPAAVRPDDPRIAGRSLRARSTPCAGELIEQRSATARAWSCSPSTASAGRDARAHQSRAARGRAARRVREELGGELLDPAPRAPSPSPIIRSPTSTCAIRDASPTCARSCSADCRASSGAGRAQSKRALGLDHPRSGELVALAAPTPGSPTTTGSTTRARPTSRAPSRSIASPATTRSSCSSIPAIKLSEARGRRKLAEAQARVPDADGCHPARRHARQRLARPRSRTDERDGPLLISSEPGLLPDGPVAAVDVKDLLLRHVFTES